MLESVIGEWCVGEGNWRMVCWRGYLESGVLERIIGEWCGGEWRSREKDGRIRSR